MPKQLMAGYLMEACEICYGYFCSDIYSRVSTGEYFKVYPSMGTFHVALESTLLRK